LAILAIGGSSKVELLTQNPEFKGSNPVAVGTRRGYSRLKINGKLNSECRITASTLTGVEL
jgi:hypothetical protein